MSVTYRESFNIPGCPNLGIEDYDDGLPDEQHFMRGEAKKRFQLWSGGCGIGTADTIEEARRKIFDYAMQYLSDEKFKANQKLNLVAGSLETLDADVFNLARFKEVT